MNEILNKTEQIADDLVQFLNATPSPYHMVEVVRNRLIAEGFQEVAEGDSFAALEGPCFTTRGGASIIAWHKGTRPVAEAGFRIVSAHTDAPTLTLKPHPVRSAHGLDLLDVETYGGLIAATWADRPLSVAGRVWVAKDGKVSQRLVHLTDLQVSIPNLAIHLNRSVNEEGLKLNKHLHLSPVLGMSGDVPGEERFFNAICRALSNGDEQITRDQIVGHDLMLCDATPAVRYGLDREFIASMALDDAGMCHACLNALIEFLHSGKSAESTAVLALFDHEECGSRSLQGAMSDFLPSVLKRLAGSGVEDYPRALSHSRQISADQAHALHPLYADKHDPAHAPKINQGPVVKLNSNQKYATSGETAAIFEALCKEVGVKCQHFVSRPDLPCGSTIGSLTAAYGIPTVDVGNPMWAMHSIRETCGVKDAAAMIAVMTAFLASK